MIDIEKVKTAALAATKGEWIHQSWGHAGSDVQLKDENTYTTLASNCTEANANHIAAANPSAVLELIARLEAAESKQILSASARHFKQMEEMLEAAEKENAELLVAIEAKDAMLEKIACVGNGDSHGNSIGNCMAIEALSLSPSAELLEQRDRKRDAKLLRDVGTIFRCRAMMGTKNGVPLPEYQYAACLYAEVELPELAAMRESGEWIPEL